MLYDMVADRSEYFRAYYKAHKAEYAARGRVWRVANPERMREHCRKANLKRHDKIVAYRLATVEKRCAWQREYEATRRDPEKRREHVWKWQAKHGAAYRAEHRERLKAQNMAWRAANAEHVGEYRAANAERANELRCVREQEPDRIERRREVQRVWGKKNSEKRRIAYRKWFAEHGQGWRENNRGRLRAYSAAYKAAQLRATPQWVDFAAVVAVYDEAARHGLEVDHIVPLQGRNVCGLHIATNLQLLTRSENRSKGNRVPADHDFVAAVSLAA